MSTKHIIITYILGLITEAALAIGAVYGMLWLLGWAAERLPGWLVSVGFAAIPILGALGIWWDSRRAIEYDAKREEECEVANG